MASRLLVLLALLAAAPVALVSAHATESHVAAVVARQEAERHTAQAVIVRIPMVRRASGVPDDVGPPPAEALVRWSTPTGERRGSQLVPGYLRAGDTVTVWLTRESRLTIPPMDPALATGNGVGVGLSVLLGVPFSVWCLHAVTKWVLDRRRMRQWTTGWQVVEPVWAPRRR